MWTAASQRGSDKLLGDSLLIGSFQEIRFLFVKECVWYEVERWVQYWLDFPPKIYNYIITEEICMSEFVKIRHFSFILTKIVELYEPIPFFTFPQLPTATILHRNVCEEQKCQRTVCMTFYSVKVQSAMSCEARLKRGDVHRRDEDLDCRLGL